MTKYFKSAITVLLFSFVSAVVAQVPTTGLPADPTKTRIVPPSPATWEFAKYGEYPVSRATGVPNISIPLYTVQSGQLQLPITLTYHAGGNKVDTRAPITGLGWSLNAGGMVCRTMKGIPDEHPNGLVNLDNQLTPGNMFNPDGMLDLGHINPRPESNYMILLGMTRGEYDSEPDVFNYNFAGYSGRFFLDPDGKPVTQPYSDIIFEFSPQRISATTPDGTKYKFEDVSHSFAELGYQSHSFPSTWMLTEIISANQADVIRLFYTGAAGTVIPLRIHTEYLSYSEVHGLHTPAPRDYIESNPRWDTERRVERIEFKSGKIKFNAVNNQRLDDRVAPKLTSVEIFSNDHADPIKSFTFHYDYFNPSGETLDKRLKLISVQEVGKGGKSHPPHEFTYLEDGVYTMPARYSFSQDYWGYYNGTGNISLLPRQDVRMPNGLDYAIGQADRNPHPEKMKAGIIRSITYPTGGKTEFDFEANDLTTPIQVQGELIKYEANAPFSSGPQSVKRITAENDIAAVIRLNMSYYGGFTPPAQLAYAEFKDETTGETFSRGEVGADNFAILLRAGHTYKVFARSDTELLVASASIEWRTPSRSVFKNVIVGGLRIKTITNFDYTGTQVTQHKYEYKVKDNAAVSSGDYNLHTLPTPQSFLKLTNYKYTVTLGSGCRIVNDKLFSVSAFPTSELGFTAGDPITYEYVTEYEVGPTSNGRVIYQHELQKDFNVGHTETFTLDRSWSRGQPKHEFYFDKDNQLVREVKFTYETINLPPRIRGLKIGKLYEASPGAPGGVCITCVGAADGSANICTDKEVEEARQSQLLLTTYNEEIQWKRLISKTETLDGVSTTTTYHYDPDAVKPHTNVTFIETVDSRKKTNLTKIRYAKELNEETLKSLNMTAIPLEYEISVDGQLIKGSRIKYRTLYGSAGGFLLPASFEEKLPDGSYRLLHEVKTIDSKGNPTMYTTAAGIKTSIIWDENNSLAIAEAVNASPDQIAYTSFENEGSAGGWTFSQNFNTTESKTGKQSFTGSSVSKILPAGNYVISFWARKSSAGNGTITISGVAEAQTISSDTWQHFQFTLPSATSASLSLSGVLLDELRLYPTSSKMTTYTNEPLIGVTSMTDANNTTVYYEFDEFTRLKASRDADKNIEKVLDYHYMVR